jgi:uncharacterized protein
MRKNVWTALLLCSAIGCEAAHAASFDCAKAKRPLERAICSDPKLSAADSTMSTAYRDDLSRLSSNSVGLLRVDQVQWLAYVQQICRVENPVTTRLKAAACLKPLYSDRIRQLRSAVGVRDGVAFLTRTQSLAEADVAGRDADMPPGEHPGYGTLQAAWPMADTDVEEWIAWSAAVEAHMLKTAGAGQVQELTDGTKQTLPKIWDDVMAAGADSQIKGVLRSVEHDRVTTVITAFGIGHGAAHPYETSETFTWLLKEKRALRADDVFAAEGWKLHLGEMAWADLSARNKKAKFLYENVDGPQVKALQDVLSDVTNWTLEVDGLHISYPDYTIAPRLFHPEDTVLPWSQLKPLLAKGFVAPYYFVSNVYVGATWPPLLFMRCVLLRATAAMRCLARCGLQRTSAKLPLAHRAHIHMDELAGGVIAHTAHAQRQCCIAQGQRADARNANINCLGKHVLRMLGDTGGNGASAQEVIGPWRAIATNDIDGGVRLAQLHQQRV